MSVKISAKVWEWSQSEGTDRLVMLALSDFCDDDGVCYPGVARIAKKCRISERSVQRAFQSLTKLGELAIEQKAGIHTNGGATNRFILTLNGGVRLTGGVRGGDIHGTKVVTNGVKGGDTAMSPDPSVEPSVKPSGGFQLSSEPKKRKIKIGTVNGHKPTQSEVEDFTASIGQPRLDGEMAYLKWNAKGWPKNWMDDIRYHKRAGWLHSQKQQSAVEPKKISGLVL